MAETRDPRQVQSTVPVDHMPRRYNPVDQMSEQETVLPASPSRIEGRRLGIAAVSGEDVEAIASADEADPSMAANTAITVTTLEDPEWIVQDAIARGEDPEVAAARIVGSQEGSEIVVGAHDFILEGVLTAGDPRYNASTARMLQNQALATEILQERIEDYDKNTFGLVLDFMDRYFLRQIPIGMVEDLTRRSERLGTDIAAAAATMDAEEFREFFTGYADELQQEGFFRSDNYFALMTGLDEAVNSGYDSMAGFIQLMGAVDALGVTATATSVIRAGARTARLSGVAGRVSALQGVEAADTAAERLIASGARTTSPDVLDETLPGTLTLSRPPTDVSIRTGRVARIMRGNQILRALENLRRQGTFGRAATPEQISQEAARRRDAILRGNTDLVIDHGVRHSVRRDALDDVFVDVTVGRPGTGDTAGLPFNTFDEAQAVVDDFANNGVAGRVQAIDPENPSLGYSIVLSERLDLTRLGDALDVARVSENLIANALGSTRAVDGGDLSTLANMGEAAFDAVVEVVTPFLKPIRRLAPRERGVLDTVITNLRDGPDSVMRRWYTRDEFDIQWRNAHPDGRLPTDAEYDAYLAVVDVSDASYVLQANRLALRYDRAGYRSITFNNTPSLARITDDTLDPDTAVFVEGRGVMRRGDLPDNVTVWRLEAETPDGVGYVVSPERVRTVQYEDVLGYNAGGRRVRDARYYITLGDENGVGRAVVTARTEAQAIAARTQLGNIRRAFLDLGVDSLDDLTDELDDVIRANNRWNPAITTTREFAEFAAARGWRLTDEVGYKAAGERIQGKGIGDLWSNSTVDDYVQSVTTRRQSRSDDLLVEFGGGTGRSFSPVRGVLDQFNSAAEEYSYRASNWNAKAGWLKRATGQEIPRGTDIQRAFEEFDMSKLRGGTQSTEAAKLRILRNQILRRDGVKSEATIYIERQMQRVSEWVHNKTGRDFGDLPGVNAIQNSLLTFGYYSAFGFANISQFILQATHAMAVVAISPVAGLRASALALPLRFVMNTPAGPIRRLAMKNFAKSAGLSVDEVEEYFQYMRTSGRYLVQGDILEKGTGAGIGISGWRGQTMIPSRLRAGMERGLNATGKAMELGMKPFTEGERLGRHTAILTSFLEFKKLRPGVSALSDEGRKWITRREQDLSFNMTSSSRGAWQTGIMRIPTQWWSYTMRAFESVVLGRSFSAPERIRLAAHFLTVGGLGGFGMHSAADQLSSTFGFEPGGNADVALRNGWIDGILSYGLSSATDEQIRTALGTRIAPFSLIVDTYRKIVEGEATPLEVLAGPSGDIISGFTGSVWDLAAGILDGNGRIPREDFERIIRTPGGINNIWLAVGMIDHGFYESRNGNVLPMEFSDLQGYLQGIGITNFEISEYYARRNQAFRDSRELRRVRSELSTMYDQALRVMDGGDGEQARQIMAEIEATIVTSGFSSYDQMSLRRSLRTANENELYQLFIRTMRDGNTFGAQVLETLEGGE